MSILPRLQVSLNAFWLMAIAADKSQQGNLVFADYTEVWRLPPLPAGDDIWPLPLSPCVSGLGLSPRGSGLFLPFTPTSPSLPGAHHVFL